MRKVDPKYKDSNAIPFAFGEGDMVVKRDGDYVFRGMIVGMFRKRSGAPRYNVENEDGVVMIMNHTQLEFDQPFPYV